ncbi:conserved hypothetical protein [Gammaproteobacteria bacterium]
MSYADFTLETVKTKLGITHTREPLSLPYENRVMPNPERSIILEDLILATSINTEKARSELIVMPILKKVAKDTHTSLFSGNRFDVDQSRDLSGFIDFLISKNSDQMVIERPILILIEAKNQDIASGYGQCIAEMVAAQIKNQNNDTVHGCVTTGEIWVFLELRDCHVRIDACSYYIKDIDSIYSFLLAICS